MVITILPDGQGTHYSMNAICGNSVLMWLGELCVFLFRHDFMSTCLVPIYMYMGIRSVLVSLVSSIRAWVRSFQLGHQHLFGVPLEMALNHHFMKQDMCVCVCSTCWTFSNFWSWFPAAYIMQDFCPGFLGIFAGYTIRFQHPGCLVVWRASHGLTACLFSCTSLFLHYIQVKSSYEEPVRSQWLLCLFDSLRTAVLTRSLCPRRGT